MGPERQTVDREMLHMESTHFLKKQLKNPLKQLKVASKCVAHTLKVYNWKVTWGILHEEQNMKYQFYKENIMVCAGKCVYVNTNNVFDTLVGHGLLLVFAFIISLFSHWALVLWQTMVGAEDVIND